jgi:drug/metabolite transporter (DMT)-like permease
MGSPRGYAPVSSRGINSNHVVGKPTANEQSKGLAWVALSAFFFASSSLFASVLEGYGIPSFQVIFGRSIIQWCLAVAFSLRKGIDPFGPRELRPLLLLRGGMGACALSCFYFSLQVLPLGQGSVLFFTSPIYTGILGHLVLGEQYGGCELALSFMCVLGVFLVAKGTTEEATNESTKEERVFGVCVALLGAVFASSIYLLIRYIGKRADALVLTQYWATTAIILSSVAFTFQPPVWPTVISLGKLLGMVLALGCTAFVAQLTFNTGVQLAAAGPSSMMRNLDVVFAFFFQVVFLHETPSTLSCAGSTVILSSIVATSYRKWAAKTVQVADAVEGGSEGGEGPKTQVGSTSSRGWEEQAEVQARPAHGIAQVMAGLSLDCQQRAYM